MTRNNNKPVDPTSHTQKPGRKIVTGHSFSPNKSSAVHEKTNTPRSYLRWIPTGRIFNTAGLKWGSNGKRHSHRAEPKVDCELPKWYIFAILRGKTRSFWVVKNVLFRNQGGSRNFTLMELRTMAVDYFRSTPVLHDNGVCRQHFRPRFSKKRRVYASVRFIFKRREIFLYPNSESTQERITGLGEAKTTSNTDTPPHEAQEEDQIDNLLKERRLMRSLKVRWWEIVRRRPTAATKNHMISSYDVLIIQVKSRA
ncbi:hypothetical protein Tco_0007205 [Tanacetum coccineum]